MKILIYTLIVLFLMGGQQIAGQNNQVPKAIPELDSSIRRGKLKNGFTYFIKHLPDEKSNLNLRLLVKAGSNQQDEDQLEIAHFLEHMAFKRSKNFPDGILNHLENSSANDMSMFSIGGYTGASVTKYIFQAPVNNQESLETGLLWYKDIAINLALTPKEIESERGVLMQERIMRSGDNFNKAYNKNQLLTHLIPCNMDDLDLMEHLKSFEPESLRTFYDDWYRPDRMVLVIVGDVTNIEDLELKIESTFSSIKARNPLKKMPDCDSLYFNHSPQFVNLEKLPDPLIESEIVSMELLYRDPKSVQKPIDFNGVLRKKKFEMFLEILNNRLLEATSNYSSHSKIIAEHTNSSAHHSSAVRIRVISRGNTEIRALETSIKTISQILKKGVLESEFEKVKSEKVKYLNNQQIGEGSFWLDGIFNHIINEVPFSADLIKKQQRWLVDYSVLDFNNFLQTLNLEMPDDIGISATENHRALSYGEKEIRTLIKRVYNQPVKAYDQVESRDFIMSPREIKNLKENNYTEVSSAESEIREFHLNNGVKLILKSFEPTPEVYKDKILIHGFKPLGAFNMNIEDYYSAIYAPEIVKNSGVGELDKFQFQKFISKNSLWWYGLKPYIRNLESGIEIDASPEDVELMLQVVYSLLHKPRSNKDAFEDWKNNEIEMYENQHIDLKDLDLTTNIQKIINDKSGASYGTDRFNGLDKVDKDIAYSIFNKLLGSANDFTFIITGNFSVDEFLPIFNKYLGNLPIEEFNIGTTENTCNLNLPEGPVYTEFYFPGQYAKDNLMYRPYHVIQIKDKYDWKENLLINALGAVLDNEIWAFRFEKGYSLYSTGAGGNYNPASKQFKIGAILDCSPVDFPILRKEYAEVILKLKTDLVTNDNLNYSLKRLKFLHHPRGRAMSNRFVNKRLYNFYRYGIPIVKVKDELSFIESITPEDIRKTARRYLKDENFFEFVMRRMDLGYK